MVFSIGGNVKYCKNRMQCKNILSYFIKTKKNPRKHF